MVAPATEEELKKAERESTWESKSSSPPPLFDWRLPRLPESMV